MHADKLNERQSETTSNLLLSASTTVSRLCACTMRFLLASRMSKVVTPAATSMPVTPMNARSK